MESWPQAKQQRAPQAGADLDAVVRSGLPAKGQYFDRLHVNDVEDAKQSGLAGPIRIGTLNNVARRGGHYELIKYKGKSAIVATIVEIESRLMLEFQASLFPVVSATYDDEGGQKSDDDIVSLQLARIPYLPIHGF